MNISLNDTIAACATAPGEGGIAIVRVSGDNAEPTMRRFFSYAARHDIESHRLYHGYIINAGEREEAMCVLMRAPKTYTRQDVCEFHIHGGTAAVDRLLKAIYASGVRPAEPGEFTRRAFMNGRIDLSQAESVMDVLRARSDAALKAGLREMNGGVTKFVAEARDELTGIAAMIEAALDFPDEIERTDIEDDAIRRLSALKRSIESACSRRMGQVLSSGFSVVLEGKPNVGKSSVMNAMLGTERAIVTDVAGTTRDVLSEYIQISGYGVMLSDTAGQRASDDQVESIGIERARSAVKSADIALLTLDTAAPLTDEDYELLSDVGDDHILVLNKCDENPKWERASISDYENKAYCACEVSAKTGAGIEEFLKRLADKIASMAVPDAIFVNSRHTACAQAAAAALGEAIDTLQSGEPVEFAAMCIRSALGELGAITGETTDEDVIDRIFNDFCVGK